MRPRRIGRAARRLGACGLIALIAASACGKKGPPLPPLRPVPARITDLTARRADGRITLQFTVPAANVDGSTPAAVERLEVYRAAAPARTAPADQPPAGQQVAAPPRAAQPPLVSPDHLIATIAVDRTPDDGTPAAAGMVEPGGRATYVDAPPAAAPAGQADAAPAGQAGAEPVAAAASLPAWRYAVVPVAGGDRRTAASNVVEVPTGEPVPPLEDVAVKYDATSWRLSWTAPEGVSVIVSEPAAEGGGPAAPVTDAPVAEASLSLPVAFGARRCFVVQPVVVRGAVTLEGTAPAPVCDTPVDTFAPPAPAGLVAVQQGTVVLLRWSASASPDLAGYVVLRGDGSGERLQPLVTAPIAGTSYRDETVQSGATYTYAVVAVDRATPPNTSESSNRETVVVREAHSGS